MDIDPYFEDLVETFRDSLNCESASLFIKDEETGDLVLVAGVGYAKAIVGTARYAVGEGLTGWVAKSGQVFVSNSPNELMSHPSWRGKWDSLLYSNPIFHSLIAVPVLGRDGNAIGVLKAENKKTPDSMFSVADTKSSQFFSRTAAIALELRQRNSRLQRFIYALVLMPFAAEFDDIYNYGIKKPIESLGITCERVDEIQYVGGVLDQVFKCIEKSRFVVADMTNRNPNVFYEVGYCHAIKKDVILCTQDSYDIPFDLRGYRHIIYSGKISKLEEEIKKMALSLIADET